MASPQCRAQTPLLFACDQQLATVYAARREQPGRSALLHSRKPAGMPAADPCSHMTIANDSCSDQTNLRKLLATMAQDVRSAGRLHLRCSGGDG